MSNPFVIDGHNFFSWLKRKHPDVSLTPLQEMFVRALYSIGRAGGKSFLIALLFEFDSENKQAG